MARATVGWTVLALVIAGCSGGGGGDLSAYCERLREVAPTSNPFADLDLADADEARAAFTQIRSTQRALRSDAPETIRADIDLTIDFVDDLLASFDESAPRTSIPADLEARFADVGAAHERLAQHAAEEC